MRKFLALSFFLINCNEMQLLNKWEERANREPTKVLKEIGDSLNSPKFRRRIARTPAGPKILNLALKISKSIDYDNLSMENLVESADGMKGAIMFIYDFGLFDERWTDALYSYKTILSSALRKLMYVENLDSLEKITHSLQPPFMAGIYKKDYEKLIELYRSKSVANGEIRWGMSEEDAIKVWGEPESVDTVYSVSNASFGKIMRWGNKAVLILNGRVEDVFEE